MVLVLLNDIVGLIFIFFGGIFCSWGMYFIDVLMCNQHDAYFSYETLEKFTVKDTSFLYKIMPFKNKCGRFLYIRAIPLFVQTLFIIVCVFCW